MAMSNKDKNSVQRFSRRNRKNELPKTGALFPMEDIEPVATPAESEPESAPEPPVPPVAPPVYTPLPELNLEALSLPDTDRDALESLSRLSRDDVRAPIITPQAERYPPLNPAADIDIEANMPRLNLEKLAAQKARSRRNFRNNVITILAWFHLRTRCKFTSITTCRICRVCSRGQIRRMGHLALKCACRMRLPAILFLCS